MENPFSKQYLDEIDNRLVYLSMEGDKSALQSLVERHQIFVYNLSLKMTRSVEDAEDLTQEVFIKAITSLGKFKGKSRFRTWLYRITVNHFLNSTKRRTEFEVVDFESYFNNIDEIPSSNLSDIEEKEYADTIEDLKIRCTSGMLLCLNREQRLIYILGEMFEIDHNLGAEIMNLTPGNFRVKLMRARNDLHSWMNQKCGLVNQNNPCRCSRKTRSYISSGLVDQGNLKFNSRYKQKIYELSEKKAVSFVETVEDLHKKVFLGHPFQQPTKKILDEIYSNSLINEFLKV
jgi:RNA polymerase sigma factor (sigma-70 family)